MTALLPHVDPDGLLEYSVVFTDRALNHMSLAFQGVMRDLSQTLRTAYNAGEEGEGVALVPGGGTYAMEAVARQLAHGKKVLVIRNGWFSYRWTQIFEAGAIPAESIVLKARPVDTQPGGRQRPFQPVPVDEAVAVIEAERPDLVFAPHVETASGMILPDAYMKAIADAAHKVGALFVLDCIASGGIWVDMKAISVDVLISAPQKGWSASPCSGIVMMNKAARAAVKASTSSSFGCDLKKWLEIMEAYENGGHAYHATLPTDALRGFRDAMLETEARGFEKVRAAQLELGARVRQLLAQRGFASVAADGFAAPTVVVCYTDDPGIKSGAKFAAAGLQTAAGVPLMCDEPSDFQTFRIGLFGLDKLADVDRTVGNLEGALNQVLGTANLR
ncbi:MULTISPECIES: aminotransferase class V-fold PLP-dependent enzyme [unclassified Mesorhizobium]|uniref:aminotransferase class V-fold PLP-dependent enzyme n=1 Tax=unclassified Mesorhizobium TaxID=325217 RepID=UPI000BAE9DDD|nr:MULTISPECIES: aminotransferase class V-fold PLP-dependent enzyme [unclassified Mesorhizobium]TGT53790.1 alanine--glyoxylate aminotransferase family protein [Mesorhizobium sp. M00.F.Ca.ET.170.01.1.1]AZO09788.1 alanine--glyoxylate aminotransferase family protein [Mesorhizobium sp. M3A.F.Ca.ET.080.04.2.1]PBB85272.1 aminotransferase [Mesorhizobium sp. WSM3876]RWB67068.1 MAG: alanine--glyoxylate aminotransferase family protein [Mesorhizobium sp.]RWB82562.1 MAG: alanine--glyoxylate aminotransfera